MKILFYIPVLIGGGAERVTVLLCNEFVKCGHDVAVATNPSKGSYPIDERVRLFSLYSENTNTCPEECVNYQLFGMQEELLRLKNQML